MKRIMIGLLVCVLCVGLAAVATVADFEKKESRIHQHLEAGEKAACSHGDNLLCTHLPLVEIETGGHSIPGAPILDDKGLIAGYTATEADESRLKVSVEITDNAETNKDYYEMNLELADWVFESLYTVLETENPNLTLVNVQSPDYIGHRFGPESDEMKTCLKRVDKALGKLYDKMKKSGMLENTTVIIVADHGMTESIEAINLNILTMMNFPETAAAIDGRTGYIWLNGTDETEVLVLGRSLV